MRAIENLSKRKPSAGRKVVSRGRRASERDRYAAETVVGPEQRARVTVRGGNKKIALRKGDTAVITDPATNTSSTAKIIKVLENPASRDYERRGVITKGEIIDTEKGRARVTSRPAQHGVINAVLLKQ
jgi:small subunit ribosomal protein S8e